MIRRVASLIGTARPRPIPATAVLTPDHATEPVGQRAAGVARVERGVGLDHVLDQAHGASRSGSAASGPGRRRRRRSPSRRGRCGLPIATTSWPTRRRVGVAELGRASRSRASARTTARSESGSAPTTSATNSRPSANAARPCRPLPGDHVRGGEHVAVGGDRDAAAARPRHRARGGCAASTRQVGDRGPQPLGDAGDRARVGVERLGVRECLARFGGL